MWIYDFAFVANSEKCREYTFLGGSSQIIKILLGGVSEIHYNITWGGCLPNLLQYYIGVGIESLLQYYSFGRKMEGYNPFSALN